MNQVQFPGMVEKKLRPMVLVRRILEVFDRPVQMLAESIASDAELRALRNRLEEGRWSYKAGKIWIHKL